ncbi:MAG: alpha/beta hydrolase [Sulfitobacter sp.]
MWARFIGILSLLCVASCDMLDSQPGLDMEVQGSYLWLNGTVDGGDQWRFRSVIADNPQLSTVALGVIDGSLSENAVIEMGYALRNAGLNTRMTSRSAVYSGGVDLFLAGVRRSVEPGAEVGVHSWANGFKTAREYPKDHRKHVPLRRYINDMLGSEAFYWFTLDAAPHRSIHLMTRAELLRYRLITN